MLYRPIAVFGSRGWILSLFVLLTGLIVACGSAAQPTNQEPPQESLSTQPPAAQSTAVAIPTETAPPVQETSAKDSVTIVMPAEPGSIDPWDTNCNATLDTAVCNEIVNEPLTWITSDNFELVPLSAVSEWEQTAPDQWRFTLRQGVKFHNGKPWNAVAAKAAIDQNGDVNNSSQSYGYHGPITAEVVDEFTVDVICPNACPILARSMIFTRIQEAEWYASATPEERGRNIVSIGPYRLIEWRPGIDIQMEAYEDYVPNPDKTVVDGQAPNIKNLTNVWRAEQLVRAAMVQTGEADWAADIGFENKASVPKWKQSTTAEVYSIILDNMWHPELKKREVREALNLAIDCQAITDALLDGIPCWGNISPSGSVGLTPRNSEPYPYDPERAKQLLDEAGYDPANKITIYTRTGYCCRDLEFQEAVVNYWKEAGVNAELQVVERTRHREITTSGCGRFADEPGYVGEWNCAQQSPPGPNFKSSNATITATSNEMLDTQVQAMRRAGCLHNNSMACYPEVWEKILVANATPPGDLRQQRMEVIADFIHDEYIFAPLVEVQLAYALAEDLEWEPLYAPRLRVNSNQFRQ